MASRLNLRQLVALAQQAGFRGRHAEQAAAIAIAESSGDPHNRYAPGPQEDSRGLMQINVVSGANPQYRSARLYDPLTNMKIAYHMSGGGSNWGPWTTYGGSTYQHALAHASGLAGKVGPYAQSPRRLPQGVKSRTIKGFKNSVTPGTVVKTDETAAALDTLMSHKHGHLLQDYVDRLSSGSYTTVEPTATFKHIPIQTKVKEGRLHVVPHGGGGGLHTITGKGLTPGRTDQGYDQGGQGYLLALGSGTIRRVVPRGGSSGWPGPGGSGSGGFVVLELDHPHNGHRFVYYAENISPRVRVGQRVTAGQPVAFLHSGYPYSEAGWAANAAGTTLASARGHVAPGSHYSPEGRGFAGLTTNLNRRAGR